MAEQGKVDRVLEVLRSPPKTASEIAKATDIDKRTVQNHLNMLESWNMVEREGDQYYLHEKGTYFQFPIPIKHQKKMRTFYAAIKAACKACYGKDPTRTQVYKVLWKVNERLELGLPIGWYQFGPCPLLIYEGEEEEETLLSPKEINAVREQAEVYCAKDNLELEHDVYEEAQEELYKLKEDLLRKDHTKETIKPVLMKLIKTVPYEAVDTVTDFASATLMTNWEKTDIYFVHLWKYLAMIRYKESLRFYYNDAVEHYLDHKIQLAKQDAGSYISGLIRSVKIETPKQFREAINAWGEQPNIPTRTKEERKQLHKEFMEQKRAEFKKH